MTDFSQYKKRLEEQLATITEELRSIGIHDPQSDDWEAVPDQELSGTGEADINTGADISEEVDERQSTLSDLEKEYRDIKRALKKIEDGTYGICEISGLPIEEKRLNIKPDARTCIAHMHDEYQLPI